ncbi:hypothetical protein FRC05_001814 [Tulasnella sp. 425]|nr:hypothetical protein FRC05_001814 [Tulasnella sp. 425]
MKAFFALVAFFFNFLAFIPLTSAAVIRRAPISFSSFHPSSSSSSHSSTTVAVAAASQSSSSGPTFHAKARVASSTGAIRAQLDITGYADGRGTYVKLEVYSGLLSDEAKGNGPYMYHIHTNPVPADGNCTSTQGHLDPLAVTDNVTCNPDTPEYCEEGDLSGKHGKLNGTADGSIDAFGFTDEFLRFWPEPLSILGRSIVFHDRNKTRIACGNIISILDGTADASNLPTGKASTYVTHYPSASSTKTNTTLPVSIARPALTMKQALFVNLTMVETTVTMNNTQTVVEVPTLVALQGVWLQNARASLNFFGGRPPTAYKYGAIQKDDNSTSLVMHYLALSVTIAASIVGVAQAGSPLWGQCGGIQWTGATTCDVGVYFSQCVPATTTSTTTTTTTTPLTTPASKTSSTSTSITCFTNVPTYTSIPVKASTNDTPVYSSSLWLRRRSDGRAVLGSSINSASGPFIISGGSAYQVVPASGCAYKYFLNVYDDPSSPTASYKDLTFENGVLVSDYWVSPIGVSSSSPWGAHNWFLACPTSVTNEWLLYLQTGSDIPAGQNCTLTQLGYRTN